MSKEFSFGRYGEPVVQESLGTLDLYADIVYCIDLTSSMTPVIEKVKETARTLHYQLQKTMRENYQRNVKRLRIRIIGFRDAYCDGSKAFETSEFFNLPEETDAFESFLNSLQAKGGGDIPENSLEALALAMQSDWCKTADASIRKRHIIIMFTDAPAHELEQAKDGIDEYYPKNMPESYSELIDWWSGQGSLKNAHSVSMDGIAKRIGIFAPERCYPWDLFEADFDGCLMSYINPNEGGNDISTSKLLKMLSETMA